MNFLFRILSWLREVGVVLLIFALFQTWFTSQCDGVGVEFTGKATTGIDLIRTSLCTIFFYFISGITYLLSRIKYKLYTWTLAIVFSVSAIVFYAHIWLIIGFGESTCLDIPYREGVGITYSLLGTAFLAIGIFTSTNSKKQE